MVHSVTGSCSSGSVRTGIGLASHVMADLDLVRSLDLPVERLAVEHNRKIIKRDHWGTQLLVDGDKIEIVQFVGGGNGWNS